jgi:hypothetical protein
MRGLRGRSGPAIAVATVLGLVVLAVSTAVVVVVAGHRPPAVPVSSRPQPSNAAVPAGQTTSAPAPTRASAVTPTARAPRTYRVDEATQSVTVPVGSLVDVELRGTSDYPWREPETTTPRLLERLSASTSPDGGARGSFRALATGDGWLMIERSSACSNGPTGGVCGVEAHRIAVNVV